MILSFSGIVPFRPGRAALLLRKKPAYASQEQQISGIYFSPASDPFEREAPAARRHKIRRGRDFAPRLRKTENDTDFGARPDTSYNSTQAFQRAIDTNEPVAEMVSPSLTTVEQRAHDIGREAGKMVLKLINQSRAKKDFAIETVILKTRLIVRGSTR